MNYILFFVTFFPAFAGFLGFFVDKKNIRKYAISAAFIEFVATLFVWGMFDNDIADFQLLFSFPLIESFGVNLVLGVDGISLFLVILSSFITLIALIGLGEVEKVKNLIISILFLEMTMVGVFLALDMIVFYLFWEFSLIPMLYIIGAWGANLRIYAAVKFFLYTFAGSVLMLVAILYFAYLNFNATGIWSFNLLDWNALAVPFGTQIWLFGAFFLAFAVKIPMFPFHTWLPYAHGQAPTIGSVILAAVLLKMGTYGLVRFLLPLFPDASVYFLYPIAIVGVIMVVYAAFVAYAQTDMKQVIAYSSISHMGIIVLGVFALNVEGITGATFFMISHGVVSGALFMLVGVIYDRRHTKEMSEFGGLATVMPKYATIFAIVLMGSVGLPLTSGFVGEFLSLIGFFKVNFLLTLLAGTGIILSAAYMLKLFRRSFFGELKNEKNKKLTDLNKKELSVLVPLVMIIIFLGIYPKPLLNPIENSVKNTVNLMQTKAVNKKTVDFIKEVNKGAK